MEAFGLLLHGFAVLMTWKIIALMVFGLVLGIFVGVLPGLGGPNGVAILLPLIAGFMRMVGKIALWKSLLTAFMFTAVMFVTFDIAFDVIMPKGPLEAALGR